MSKIVQRVNRYTTHWIGIVFVVGIYFIRICFVLRASDFGFKSLYQWSCDLPGGLLRPPSQREERSLQTPRLIGIPVP